MDSLSQLDVSKPDHVSVITRDGKITISVQKDGASVTLGFPIRDVFNTKPPLSLQQVKEQPMMSIRDKKIAREYQREAGLAYLEKLAMEDQGVTPKPTEKPPAKPTSNTALLNGPTKTSKLTPADVKEIKEMLQSKDFMASFGSRASAYKQISRAYGVTHYCIKGIDHGETWRWLKV